MIRRILESNFVAFLVIAVASASLYLLYSKGRERETLIGIALLLISVIFLWWGNRPKSDDEYPQPHHADETKAYEAKAPRVAPESRKAKKASYVDRPTRPKSPGKKPNGPPTDAPNKLRPVERYRREADRDRDRSTGRGKRKPIERIRIARSPRQEKKSSTL